VKVTRRRSPSAEGGPREATTERSHLRSPEGLIPPLAHEIGNLLAAMRLAGHLLGGPLEPEDRALLASEVERLAAQAGALLALLRPLLAPGELARLAPRELLSALRRGVSDCVPEGVDLTVASGRGLPDVRVDPDAVHHALTALVLAAIEAVGADGRVRVTAAAEGRRVRLSLADDGPRFGPVELGNHTTRGRALVVELADAVLRAGGGRAQLAAPRRGARLEVWLPATPTGRRRPRA